MNETSSGIAVLFFNPHNIGEYAIVNVKRQDIVLEKEKTSARDTGRDVIAVR